MKFAFMIFGLLLTQSGFAATLSNQSCKDSGITFNSVTNWKTYSNGQIKVFSADRVEPAVSPMGLVVTLDRGQELATMESFCRYIGGLSDVTLDKTVSSYDPKTNSLTLEVPVRYSEDGNTFKNKTLVILVSKEAKKAREVVRASLK